MSVLKDFYQVQSKEQVSEHLHLVAVTINGHHEIFKGHFPGNPVTPGVCMMQIVKDLAEEIFNKKLVLVTANNVKFMAIINPEETPELTLELEIVENNDEIKVKNTTKFGETIALKMSVQYKIQPS